MELVAFVAIVALLQVMFFQARVGFARNRFEIPGPATSGHPIWERYNRVHLNTVENLVVFLPLLGIFARYFHAGLAALLGVAFIFARFIYARAYVKDPPTRSTGAWLTSSVLVLLAIGSLVGVIGSALGRS